MSALAFVDTETTGLDPDLHEIWEVGLILRDSAFGESEYHWRLPVDLGRADPMALKISGYFERADSLRLTNPEDFARQFEERTRGAHLVGAVISFDEERLRRLLRRHGCCPMWHYHLIDVEALAVGYLYGSLGEVDGDRQFPRPSLPWRSDDLSRECGVEPPGDDQRHTALGDARWARDLYDSVTGSAS